MSKTLIAFILCTLAVTGPAVAQGLTIQQRLRSRDEQVRVDAVFEVLGDGVTIGPHHALVEGKTPREICALLGEPYQTQQREGPNGTWLVAYYQFGAIPTHAKGRKSLVKHKWKYGPKVVFREGISVDPQELEDALTQARGGNIRGRGDPGWRILEHFPCGDGGPERDSPAAPN
jgi:hypothetical protein